jgi:hypothetical protein
MSESQYGEVTIERVERGLAIMAYIITLDRKYTPLFEKMEHELEAMRRQEGTVERAKRLFEAYSTGGHPRLSLAPPIASEGPETGDAWCSQHRAPTRIGSTS